MASSSYKVFSTRRDNGMRNCWVQDEINEYDWSPRRKKRSGMQIFHKEIREPSDRRWSCRESGSPNIDLMSDNSIFTYRNSPLINKSLKLHSYFAIRTFLLQRLAHKIRKQTEKQINKQKKTLSNKPSSIIGHQPQLTPKLNQSH